MSINTAIYNQQSGLSRMSKCLTLCLCSNFVVLYGIRLQLHTVFVRHSSLIISALLGCLLSSQKCTNYTTIMAGSDWLDSGIYECLYIFLLIWFGVMTVSKAYEWLDIFQLSH